MRLSKYEMSNTFRIKSIIIFFLVAAIFIGWNVDRIVYELDFYKANFKKNARGLITVRCDDGQKAFEAIDKSIRTRESSLISMKSIVFPVMQALIQSQKI